MKGMAFSNGVLLITTIVCGQAVLSNAAHAHHHNDVLDRIMHKPSANSGSSAAGGFAFAVTNPTGKYYPIEATFTLLMLCQALLSLRCPPS